MTDADEGEQPVPPRFWWLKRLAVSAGALIVLLGVCRWVWGVYADRRLETAIAQLRAAGEPIEPEDFDPPEDVPAASNAAILLQQAAAGVTLNKTETALVDEIVSHPEWVREHAAELGAIVDANRAAIDQVRAARDVPAADWGVRIRTPAINTVLPALSSQRQLVKVTMAAALVAAQRGDSHETLERIRDLLAIEAKLDRHPTLIAHMVAGAAAEYACSALEWVTPALAVSDVATTVNAALRPATREQAHALIRELLDERAAREGLIRAYQCERMLQLDTCRQFLGSGTAPRLWAPGMISPSLPVRVAFRPLFANDGAWMLQWSSGWVAAARRDNYPAARQMWPPDLSNPTGLEQYTHYLSRMLLPSLERTLVINFHVLARRRTAAIALAIRLFELDHGQRPTELVNLVPEYLPAVPADPFASDGRAIGYRPDGERPVLYSISVNGIDESGTPGPRKNGRVMWDEADIVFSLTPPIGTPNAK